MDNTSEQFTTLRGKTGSCREQTLPLDHQDSKLVGWIRGHTRIGPVREVRVICCVDQCGIEIQVSSTSRNGSYSFPEAQTAAWMNFGMTKMTLIKTLKW